MSFFKYYFWHLHNDHKCLHESPSVGRYYVNPNFMQDFAAQFKKILLIPCVIKHTSHWHMHGLTLSDWCHMEIVATRCS